MMKPWVLACSLLLLPSMSAIGAAAAAAPPRDGVTPPAGIRLGGELRFAMRSDPKTFDPLVSADQSSEMVIQLIHERVLRLDRKTRKFEPGLAESWKVLEQGRKIQLQLRKDVRFSDGTPFSARDIEYTIKRLADPQVNSPKSPVYRPEQGKVVVEVQGPDKLTIAFPEVLPSIESEIGQLQILSAKGDVKVGLGPFQLQEYKPASHLKLARNANYWRMQNGKRLPYLDSLRIDIVGNPDLELERFRSGELQLLDTVDATAFDRLQKDLPGTASDIGPSFDIDFLWFNQAPGSPLAPYKLAWFQSRNFRRAVSAAIHRDDLVRLAYQGHATVAAGIISPANRAWYKAGLTPHAFDLALAKKLLAQDGFRQNGSTLVDKAGHPVEFSLITNSGNKVRGRMASLIQQDLAKLGIKVNVTAFDFPSLVERIGRTLNYEACLLGFVNVNADPMGSMNVLLSSGPQHMWNPNQKTPANAWEAEIDKAMRAQAATADAKKRRAAFDKVQQILHDEAPVLFLAHRNTLVAMSPKVANLEPTTDFPRLIWNSDRLAWGAK